MKKQVIAVDIDDVLANSTDTLRLFVNEKRGVALEKHHYRVKTGVYWGYYKAVWNSHDIDGDGIIDEFHDQYAIDQSHVPPIEGAFEALASLSEQFRLIAISARSASQQAATERWLDDKFDGLFESISCIDTLNNPDLTKGEACRIAGASYLIDDSTEHCKSALDRGVQAVLFGDYGWHDENDMPDGLVRCLDWNSVLEYFDERG